jgi:hypothetical protein
MTPHDMAGLLKTALNLSIQAEVEFSTNVAHPLLRPHLYEHAELKQISDSLCELRGIIQLFYRDVVASTFFRDWVSSGQSLRDYANYLRDMDDGKINIRMVSDDSDLDMRFTLDPGTPAPGENG